MLCASAAPLFPTKRLLESWQKSTMVTQGEARWNGDAVEQSPGLTASSNRSCVSWVALNCLQRLRSPAPSPVPEGYRRHLATRPLSLPATRSVVAPPLLNSAFVSLRCCSAAPHSSSPVPAPLPYSASNRRKRRKNQEVIVGAAPSSTQKDIAT